MYIYLHLWRKHMVFKWYSHLVLGCKRSFLYSSTFHQDLISYQTALYLVWSVFKVHLTLLVCIPDTPLHFPFISFSVTGHQLKERKGGGGGGWFSAKQSGQSKVAFLVVLYEWLLWQPWIQVTIFSKFPPFPFFSIKAIKSVHEGDAIFDYIWRQPKGILSLLWFSSIMMNYL